MSAQNCRPRNIVSRNPGCFFILMLGAFVSCASWTDPIKSGFDIACESTDTCSRVAEDGPIVTMGHFRLILPEDARHNHKRHARLIKAATTTIKLFEHNEKKVKPATIFLTDKPQFNVAAWIYDYNLGFFKPGWIEAVGVYHEEGDRIACITGEEDTIPALYHELSHLCLDSSVQHINTSVWAKCEVYTKILYKKIKSDRGE